MKALDFKFIFIDFKKGSFAEHSFQTTLFYFGFYANE